jgi:hypothetical protein
MRKQLRCPPVKVFSSLFSPPPSFKEKERKKKRRKKE